MAAETRPGYVYRTRLTVEALADLLRRAFGGGDTPAYAVLRRVDGCKFPAFAADKVVKWLESTLEGQAFSRDLEVRWRPGDGEFFVMALAEVRLPALFAGEPDAEFDAVPPSESPSHGIHLWGTRADGDRWLETRIPQPLRYPLSGGSRPPRIDYLLYRERASAAVRWVRLREVRPDAT